MCREIWRKGSDMIGNRIGIVAAALALSVNQACAAPKPTIVLVHDASGAETAVTVIEALGS